MAFLLKHYTFSAKIRNLTDFYQRILTNQQPPSGLDIVNTLRYFQQTLLGLLKDVQNAPVDSFICLKAENQRSSLFPNLNYGGLYHALNNIIDVYPQVSSGQIALGSAILNTLQCLYLFLERELIDQLPYNVACLFSYYPPELHADILRLLCNVLLPFTLQNVEETTYAVSSTSTVIMMTFQFCQDARHHTWVLETLMSFKTDVYKDVLSVIAHGTSESRIPAANLLFHYWPFLNPGVLDRKTIQYKTHAWTPTRCQHKNCSSGDNNLSIKKCYNPFICAEAADSAPPIFLCSDCGKTVAEENKKSLFRFCQPMSTVVNVCQNKECNSSNRLAVCTCFTDDCVRANGYVPLRLCQECHLEKHKDVKHMCHTRLPSPWQCDKQTFIDMIIAVVSLLKETSYMMEELDTEKRPKWLQQLEGSKFQGVEMVDERRMLSRYGVWMLVGLCTPSEDTPVEAVGHLMAMLFQWFGTTALLPSDNTGAALEQLKNDFLCEWLRKVTKTHNEVFIQCLLPKPPDFAKVGGNWEKLSRRTDQLKEGLAKILALMPYDLINFETWDKIMPMWLEAISTEIPEKDLAELRVLLCKIFEIDMCSLPFPPEQIYQFIGTRLKSADFNQQQQAVDWIQLLTDVDIYIPLEILLNFYSLLAKNLGQLERPLPPARHRRLPKDSIGDHEGLQMEEDLHPLSPMSPEECPVHRQSVFGMEDDNNATIFVVLIDILIRQLELTDFTFHEGTASLNVQKIMVSITDILKAPWSGQHVCDDPQYDDFVDCIYCRDTTIFFELLMDVVQKVCPKESIKIEMPPEEDYDWEEAVRKEASLAEQESEKTATASGEMQPDGTNISGPSGLVAAHPSDLAKVSSGPDMHHVMTATMQEEAENVEFVGILPTEELETAVAQATVLAEPDVGLATCKVVTTTLVDEIVQKGLGGSQQSSTPEVQFWHTSQGKFRFTLEELPAQLQMIYALMNTIDKHPDPDVIYYILHSMKYLCLHAEALNNAHKENRGFLIWAQENILISKLWFLLQAQYSQIPQMCVPLILHCLTLPSGADIFWKVVNEDFTSNDWKIRFAAVEKVTCIARFLDPAPVRGNTVLQGALANAFSFLIAAAQDPNSVIAQRALMYIETIKPSSLKCLCTCLESQFDMVIADRPLIIHRLILLSTLLPEQPILTWDFFLQRFDSLSMEAQIQLEKTGEIAYPQGLQYSPLANFIYFDMLDLLHSDPMSDLYQRKMTRARQALEQSENVRSIVKNLDKALNYQKTLSINAQSKLAKLLADKPEGATSSAAAASAAASIYSSPRKSATSISHRLMSGGGAGLEPSSLALGKLREFTDRESNFCMLLNKALDLENTERHTMHLMLTLFMKFLANPKTALINPDEKAAAKKQSIVLRHLNVLLGYSAGEKCFTIPPFRLRASAICNAFIASLPQVLDTNLLVGNQILPLASMILQYLPSPQRYASDYQPPNYSLWYLEPHTRHCWLWSLLLILYKYRFDQPPINESVLVLIQIVVNTLNAQIHQCQQVEVDYRTPLFRSRVSSWQGSSNKIFSTTPATTTASVAAASDSVAARNSRLRRVFNTVRLLVRVMRSWPRVDGDTPPQFTVGSAENSSEDTSESSEITPPDDTEEPVSISGDQPGGRHHHGHGASSAQGPSAAERYHSRRKAQTTTKKQPTFDEREEQFLEETENIEDLPQFETVEVTLENQGLIDQGLFESATPYYSETGNGVDSRILEQIEEFDRSFSFRESMSPHDDSPSGTSPFQTLGQASVVQPTILEPDEDFMTVSISQPQVVDSDQMVNLDEMEMCTAMVEAPEIRMHRPVVQQMQAQIVEPETLSMAKQSLADAEGSLGRSDDEGTPTRQRPKLKKASRVEDEHDVDGGGVRVEVEESNLVRLDSVKMKPLVMMGGGDDKAKATPVDGQQMMVPRSVVLEAISEEATSSAASMAASDAVKKISATIVKPRIVEENTFLSVDDLIGENKKLSGSKSSKDKERYEIPPICIGSLRYAETTVVLRCTQCNAPYEIYDEDTISLAVVCLSTFIHREPGMAAPHLLRILISVAKIANHVYYPWQAEGNLFVPGNCRSVARQFLRVALHQLAPNKLFTQLFQSDINDRTFFKTVNSALADFTDLNPVMVLQHLLKDISINWPPMIHHVLFNLADFIVNIAVDSYLLTWGLMVPVLDAFLRRFVLEMTDFAADIPHLFTILNHVLHVQSFHTFKSGLLLLDSASKLLSKIIQTHPVKLVDLLNLCSSCNRAFLKERDKEGLARCCVNELVQAIKFKNSLPEDNYMTIVRLILEDIGETVDESIDKVTYNTATADVAKTFLQDFIDFIADLHVLHRMKNLVKGSGLREDTLGGELKAGLARYAAYEISRASSRDPRTIIRHVPWLLSPPSVTLQGPNEFIECVGHVRQLSWILLGALYINGTFICMPIPIETSHHISDHIQFVLAGFAEQSKESVLHMSALFHAFHLCQLWTVYCEEIATRQPDTEIGTQASMNVTDFWARITPAILQLLSHSKVLADMVNLHFLNTVEALMECDSAIINRLFPMWHPILAAYHPSVPSHLVVRLDTCENAVPKIERRHLEPWLKRVCFKISQVELQSSAATQFYTV